MQKKWLKRIGIVLGIVLTLLTLLIFWYSHVTKIVPPLVGSDQYTKQDLEIVSDSLWKLGPNFLQKNDVGLYEMYIEGDGYQRGIAHGILCEPLLAVQEQAFVSQIQQIIPNKKYLSVLKYGTLFFNRNMPAYVPDEYLQEIYGISKFHPDSFQFIGKNYDRVLNYHAAHDIGHTMQQYMLVGCTSFGAWDGFTQDSQIVIGRNFDFYVGDAFAENKVVSFYNPDAGIPFMTVSWPGFIGAVSGLNLNGISVTLNAASGAPPTSTKMPIALLAREILQYASTIDEAVAICRKRETFVSESILIGSAADHKTVIIEKSPDKLDVFESPISKITCSNHFQSKAFEEDSYNIENIEKSDSPYRFERMNELVDQHPLLEIEDVASILRNQKGLYSEPLGYGNQKAINQLICHHSVIIKPEERKIWVSTDPYNLGAYICYDLKEIFEKKSTNQSHSYLYTKTQLIKADPFLNSAEFAKFELFKKMRPLLNYFIKHPKVEQPIDLFFERFEEYNPQWYHTQELLGDYYVSQGNIEKARKHYTKALKLEVASLSEKVSIFEKLEALK